MIYRVCKSCSTRQHLYSVRIVRDKDPVSVELQNDYDCG
jgi:hypothetical protein